MENSADWDVSRGTVGGVREVPGAAEAGSLRSWQGRYVCNLRITDLLIVVCSTVIAQLVWFDSTRASLSFAAGDDTYFVSYTAVSLALVACWYLALGVVQSRDPRVFGANPEEYRRVLNASIWIFGIFAITSYLLKLELARGYFLTTIPIGVFGLLLARWLWRQWLVRQRAQGRFCHQTVVVGAPSRVATVLKEIQRHPDAGYLAVGVCVDGGKPGSVFEDTDIPVLGDTNDAVCAMKGAAADTLVVTASPALTAKRVKEISWDLETSHHEMLLSPMLVDVAGPRITTRPVGTLPLMHIAAPNYVGSAWVTKRALDLLFSAVLLVVLSPALLVIALIVKFTSPGPVLFRQQRVGRNGKLFTMLKFRSMVADADRQLAELLKQQGTAKKPLFKVKNDPRLTRVGAFLRKYSLDELPQLFNVLRGNMSLVGPRPQVPAEVALYDAPAVRRLNVLPGITGLWQVSGRSDLSWDEAIRFDLYYVENWSFVGDLIILWRTFRAVFRHAGSY